MINPDPIMRTREVAEYTHIPEATLRWHRHIGQGPRSFKLGRRTVAYRKSDVDAWLAQQYAAEAVEVVA